MKSMRIRRYREDRLAADAANEITLTPDQYDTEVILCEREKKPIPMNRLPTIRGRDFCKWYVRVSSTIGWISIKGKTAIWSSGDETCLRVKGCIWNADTIKNLVHFEDNITVEGYISKDNCFYGHTIISPPHLAELNFEQQLAFLKLNRFTVAEHGLFTKGSLEQTEIYITNKLWSNGAQNLIVASADRASDKALFYIAKGTGISMVHSITWLQDQCANLVPRINIKPIIIRNRRIESVSGHNAQFIIDEGLGTGAMIRIRYVEGTMPIVDAVLGCTEPDMPSEAYEWKGIHIVPCS